MRSSSSSAFAAAAYCAVVSMMPSILRFHAAWAAIELRMIGPSPPAILLTSIADNDSTALLIIRAKLMERVLPSLA